MVRVMVVVCGLGWLAACSAQTDARDHYAPGADHSLATSSCTNGDPVLRQAKLGCPN